MYLHRGAEDGLRPPAQLADQVCGTAREGILEMRTRPATVVTFPALDAVLFGAAPLFPESTSPEGKAQSAPIPNRPSCSSIAKPSVTAAKPSSGWLGFQLLLHIFPADLWATSAQQRQNRLVKEEPSM